MHRRTIFCDYRSKNAKAILAKLGLDFAERAMDADLVWMRRGYEGVQYILDEHQLLNHIPNERAMTNKGELTGHLKAFDRRQKRREFVLDDFYPETYRLYLEEERRTFLAQFPPEDTKENLWILKPAGLSSGRGVRVMWRNDELRRFCRENHGDPPGGEADGRIGYIAQRYIQNPLLLEGRKSEIRLYWLIACLDPLLVLMYREGTVRLNSLPFRLDDFDNVLIHVTNVYQQKRHPDYDPSIALKWGFPELQSCIAGERRLADSAFVEQKLKPQFRRYLAFVVRSVLELLRKRPPWGLYFGVYGADLILDDTLHPWLTEIQKGPGLSHDDPIKKGIVPEMLCEAASIVLEIQERKRKGASLARLESVRGFEWVIHAA